MKIKLGAPFRKHSLPCWIIQSPEKPCLYSYIRIDIDILLQWAIQQRYVGDLNWSWAPAFYHPNQCHGMVTLKKKRIDVEASCLIEVHSCIVCCNSTTHYSLRICKITVFLIFTCKCVHCTLENSATYVWIRSYTQHVRPKDHHMISKGHHTTLKRSKKSYSLIVQYHKFLENKHGPRNPQRDTCRSFPRLGVPNEKSHDSLRILHVCGATKGFIQGLRATQNQTKVWNIEKLEKFWQVGKKWKNSKLTRIAETHTEIGKVWRDEKAKWLCMSGCSCMFQNLLFEFFFHPLAQYQIKNHHQCLENVHFISCLFGVPATWHISMETVLERRLNWWIHRTTEFGHRQLSATQTYATRNHVTIC